MKKNLQQYFVCIYHGKMMMSYYLPAADVIEATKQGVKQFLDKGTQDGFVHTIKTFHESAVNEKNPTPLFEGEYWEGMNLRKIFELE